MASKEEGDQRKALNCPVCLDVFKNATILNCGHTFCKACLEAYDKQHYARNHIRCPMCREKTKLGLNRVAGLTPNFSLKGLVDALNEEDAPSILKIDDPSSELCVLHKKDYKTIFCEVCKEFICISWFIENHQGHEIKRKEESEHGESELKKKTDDLFQNCEEKKIQVEKSVEIGYQFKEAMNSHFDKLDREVRDTIVKKSAILQENEQILLEKIGALRKESVEQMDKWISHRKQIITSTDCVITELTNNTSQQKDTFQSHHLKYSELNAMLKVAIDDDSASRVKERVVSAQFRVAEEKLLDLEYVEVAPKAGGSSTSRASMPIGLRRQSEEMQESSSVSGIPAVVKHGSLNIVNKVELNYEIYGMAACSEDAVVVGYGVSRKGSDYISVSGSVTPHLKKTVGHVYSVAFLTNGSQVVAQSKKAFMIYNPHGTCHTGGQKCKPGKEFLQVCTDKHDQIYAVNGNREIYIFRDGKLLKVVPTGRSQPKQVCVTREGHAVIMSTCDTYPSTVSVYDGVGQMVKSIRALRERYNNDDGDNDYGDDYVDDDDDDDYSDDNDEDEDEDDDDDDDDDDDADETDNGDNDDDDDYDDYDETADDEDEEDEGFFYAAVDSKDRVLVAKVSVDSERFRLSRYTFQGGTLIAEMVFTRSFLLPELNTDIECHMVSLTPILIAFASGNVLYFMKLAD